MRAEVSFADVGVDDDDFFLRHGEDDSHVSGNEALSLSRCGGGADEDLRVLSDESQVEAHDAEGFDHGVVGRQFGNEGG